VRGPIDGRGDGGVPEHERDGKLDERDASLVGEFGECVGGVELALVLGQGEVVAVDKPPARFGHRTLDIGALAVAAGEPAPRERTP
jgi:hypothetical protein